MLRASCCSARLSRAQMPAFVGSSVWDKKKRGGEGMRGNRLHWQVQGNTSSLTRVSSRQRCCQCYSEMGFIPGKSVVSVTQRWGLYQVSLLSVLLRDGVYTR